MLKFEESRVTFMYLAALKFNDTVKLSVEKKYHDLLIYFWTFFFLSGPCFIFYYHFFMADLRITIYQCLLNIIFCIIPFCIHFFITRLDHILKNFFRFNPFSLLIAFLLCLVSTFFYFEVFAKRIIFFVLFTPINLILFRELFNFYKIDKTYEVKLIIIFCKITLIMLWLPGGYAPPFYNGIAGWTIKYKNFQKDIKHISGIKLIRNDGISVWMPFGVLSPMNFVGRHFIAYKKKYPEYMTDLYKFYYKTYCYNFKILEQGFFPNQRYLKKFAYPGHTPYVMQNFKGFKPETIKSISWVEEKIRIKDKKVLSRYVMDEFTIPKEFREINCDL